MIGLGITAYSRPDYLEQCLEAATNNDFGGARIIRVAIDFKNQEMSDKLEAICQKYSVASYKATENIGVGKAKNWLLRELLADKCTHLFLMEDDILITNPVVCHAYIEEAERLGVKHLNFGLHGARNELSMRRLYKFANGQYGYVYPNIVGAFSYYHRDYIEKYGFMDEHFKNAWEHVEHTFRVCFAENNPPFWMFADHSISHKLLREIPGSFDNSSIAGGKEHEENKKKGQAYWLHKWGQWLPEFPTRFYKEGIQK